MRPWIIYTVVRLGLFAALVTLMLLLGVQVWLAALLAAIVGLCLSYIFLGRLRAAVAADIVERRAAKAQSADDAEDALLDRDE